MNNDRNDNRYRDCQYNQNLAALLDTLELKPQDRGIALAAIETSVWKTTTNENAPVFITPSPGFGSLIALLNPGSEVLNKLRSEKRLARSTNTLVADIEFRTKGRRSKRIAIADKDDFQDTGRSKRFFRPNDVIWIFSGYVPLGLWRPPVYLDVDPKFIQKAEEFIIQHRDELRNEIRNKLATPVSYSIHPRSDFYFGAWEDEVLARCCKDRDDLNKTIERIKAVSEMRYSPACYKTVEAIRKEGRGR